MNVVITGFYSGPSPSAGLGVTRSIKAAVPTAHITGIDYWTGSSGLQHEAVDEVTVMPQWEVLDRDLYAQYIRDKLAAGSAFLPCLDLEIRWLADALPAHPLLLSPGPDALRLTRKPASLIATELGLGTPEFLSCSVPDPSLHAFCRRHSFRVWLKSPHHGAALVRSWRELVAVRSSFASAWGEAGLFLQAHVHGHEESLVLIANQGRMLDGLHMIKRITTPEGKTWAGRVLPLAPAQRAALERVVARLNWHGAAEIEVIRDLDGGLWLNEWNPRFPAWIHGASLCGRNLPASLVAAVTGTKLTVTSAPAPAREFTRVVLEIPVREGLPLPLAEQPPEWQVGAVGKYAAGLQSLAVSLAGQEDAELTRTPPELSPQLRADVTAYLAQTHRVSPDRFSCRETATNAFRAAAERARRASTPELEVEIGYSVKTSPDDIYLELALKNGFDAECISQLEVARALEAGFSKQRIVLNGPAKNWPHAQTVRPLKAIYADSLEELESLVSAPKAARTIGLRIKLPCFFSRFGIDIANFERFSAVCDALRRLPIGTEIGIHHHLASAFIGQKLWNDAFDALLSWADAIGRQVGRPVTTLDLGGGYYPEDLATLDLAGMAAHARAQLPRLQRLVLEPGRALTQETMGIATRVLEVRRPMKSSYPYELVVDACIAELPLCGVQPHRVIHARPNGTWHVLARGYTRVLGRICMEDDILSEGLQVADDIAVGDRLLFLDAGAYDRSMSYEFGKGGLEQTGDVDPQLVIGVARA
jgi:diaminopimelate decarboxylase